MKTLLVIDDEKSIVRIIRTYFEDNSYRVLSAGNAQEGERLLSQNPDIILLDIMMPGMDGIAFCRTVRDRLLCPIVFLSAKTEETSKLLGLTAGGDDYITKPFSVRELYARVEAHLRRDARPKDPSRRIVLGPLWIDCTARECGTEEGLVDFTKKEFDIIEFLALNRGQVFSQDRIYDKVWGYDADGDASSAVTEHVKRIRRKLAERGIRDCIETVWGIGYKWKR